MEAVRRAELNWNRLISRDLWISNASGEQADGSTDDCERSTYVPGEFCSGAEVHLSPFHIFGVFPDRIQHGISGTRTSSNWLPQHGDSSCEPNLTPANVDNPALSLISRGSLSLVLSFAFRCPK